MTVEKETKFNKWNVLKQYWHCFWHSLHSVLHGSILTTSTKPALITFVDWYCSYHALLEELNIVWCLHILIGMILDCGYWTYRCLFETRQVSCLWNFLKYLCVKYKVVLWSTWVIPDKHWSNGILNGSIGILDPENIVLDTKFVIVSQSVVEIWPKIRNAVMAEQIWPPQ